MSHTPGPWVYDSGGFYAQCQLDENGMTYESPIAELLEGRPDDSKGNALLIAAAPDLLEACEVVAKAMEATQICEPELLVLKAAIDKARGEQ